MDPGDLGRRVAERRKQLGLSAEELAARAGMSSTYVRVLESSSSAHPSRGALLALAAALGTSVGALSGGGVVRPPGGGAPSGTSALETLDANECRSLTASGGVGRLVYADGTRPVAVPVNFRMLGDDIVIRTETEATVVGLGPDTEVSFEVDRLDDALTEGWSVLFSGHAGVISDPGELRAAERLDLAPWAGGDRPIFVRVVPEQVSGRRIRNRPES